MKTKIFVKCVVCDEVWEGNVKDFKRVFDGDISVCKKLEKLPDDCEYITFKCNPCIAIENREYEKEHPEICEEMFGKKEEN